MVLKDGKNQKSVTLQNPTKGVLIPTMVWRELRNFSAGSVCLVLASEEYEEEDYIRDWEVFKTNVELF